MPNQKQILCSAVVAVALSMAHAAQAYERELNARSVREAYFLGKNAERAEKFASDYVRTFPLPEQGVHVERIEIATPFKQMVERAWRAQDGYNAVSAESEYEQAPPPVSVEVTLKLTPTFSAHTPYAIPVFGPIDFRAPDFWQEFEIRLVQDEEVVSRAVAGRPLYTCDVGGACWLIGAVVRLDFDPDAVASRPARVLVLTPDGQRLEAEFDFGQLR